MKRFSRLISRIIEYPQIIFARARGIYWNHLYSCLLAEDLLGKVKPRTIIDVGSNKGDFIRACKYAFPKSIIYAFEPLKSQYGNNIKKIAGIKSFNFGLWNKDSQAILFKNLQYDGASSFLKPTEDYHLCLGKAEKIVEEKSIQKRFDSLNLPIERPCFLKVDVEGAEERVLR